MSRRGSTHRHRHSWHRKPGPPPGQRNRKRDKWDGQLADFPSWLLFKMRRTCERKVSYSTWSDAQSARKRNEREFGKSFYAYECPLCGRWHLTTHPRSRDV